MKEFESLEEMFADIASRVEAGKKAAEDHPIKVKDLRHGECFAYHHPVHDIHIFGEVVEKTEYPEDDKIIESARENGFVFGRCYSVMCPEGELGDTHITYITHKISRSLFDRARANGFHHLKVTN
jgi:hypothetical protein